MQLGSITKTPRRIFVGLLLAVAGVGLAPLPTASAAEPTVVSLLFNDGLISQHTHGAPVLDAHGVDGTFYVSSNFVASGDANYMAGYHLDELVANGHEIGGMGRDHVDLTATYFPDEAQDLAYKQDQVCGDREWLADRGYAPVSFGYPFAAVNGAAQSLVQDCGYLSGRSVGGLSSTVLPHAESIPPANPYWVSTAGLGTGPITLQQLQDAVTAATVTGDWLPIAFNRVCKQGTDAYATCMQTYQPVDADVLDQFLSWVETAPGPVTIETVREVMGSAPPPVPDPRPTVVSLTFDDGLASQYPLRTMFAQHDMEATFYINSAAVDAEEDGAMTWGQIENLAADGHDIGGHTSTHVDLTDPATSTSEKWQQTCGDRARLVEQGFNPVSFAYPFATFSSAAADIVRSCGYLSGRTGGTISPSGPQYASPIPPADPFTFWALGTTFDGPISLASLQEAVNAAAGHGGGWVPMVFHEVCYPGTSSYASCMNGYRPVDAAVLEDFLAWAAGQSARGISVRDVAAVHPGSAAPAVRVTAPAAGASTPASGLVISGTAEAGAGPVTVSVYEGGTTMGTPVAVLDATSSGGSWTASPGTTLDEGSYTVQARQSRGGVTGVSAPRSFQVTGGSQPATEVAITSPGDGATLNDATPTVSGTTNAQGSVSVEVFSGPAASGAPAQVLSAPVGANGTWSATATALADGTYTVRAGAGSAVSDPVTFTVDSTAPAVAITSPANGSTGTATAWSVTGTAGTAATDGTSVSVQVWAGTSATGTPLQTVTAPVTAAGTWTTQVSVTGSGSFTMRATQTDAAGNTGTSAPVTTTVTASQPALPVTSVSPGTLGQGASNITVRVNGTGFNSSSQVTVGGSGVTATVTGRTSSRITLRVSVADGASPGARDVTVRNADGRTGTCSGCFTVAPGPKITAVSPSTVPAGRNTRVTITGANFDSSTRVEVGGLLVGTSGLQVVNANTLSVVLRPSALAPRTARDVTVRSTSNQGTQTLSNGVSIGSVLSGQSVREVVVDIVESIVDGLRNLFSRWTS